MKVNPSIVKLICLRMALLIGLVIGNIQVFGQTTCYWTGSGPWSPNIPPTTGPSTSGNTYIVQSGTCNITASGKLLNLIIDNNAYCNISSGVILNALNSIDIFGTLINNSSDVTTETLLVESSGSLDNGMTTPNASISINTKFSIGGNISNAVNIWNYYMAFSINSNARILEIFNSKTVSLKNLVYSYSGLAYLGQLTIRENATFSSGEGLNINNNLLMQGGNLIDSASLTTNNFTATNANFITSPTSSTLTILNSGNINSGATSITSNIDISGKTLQIDGSTSNLQVNNATTTIGTLTLTNGGTYQSTASLASSLNITSVSSIDGHLTLNNNTTVNTFPSSISVSGANSSIDYLNKAGLSLSVTGPGTSLNHITARYLSFTDIPGSTPATLGNSTLDSINLSSTANVTLNNPVTINKHAKIYTTGVLTSNGNLTISDGSALYFIQNSAIVGNVIMKRNLTYQGLTQFGSSLDIALTDFGSDWIGQYLESNNPGSARWVKLTSGNLIRGQGYERSTSAAREFSVIGRPNVSAVSLPLSYTTTNNTTWNGQRGFNLVSNPYTAPISISDFFTNNTNISQSIQLWDNTTGTGTGDYIVVDASGIVTGGINPVHIALASTGYLAPQQGFFVKANDAGRNVNFNYSQVTESLNNNFLKSAIAMDYIKLQIKSTSGLYNEMVVRFIDGATDNFDNKYDAYKFKGNANIALYSKLEKEDLIIQSYSPLTQDKSVKVGVRAMKDENYTFQIPNFNNFSLQNKIYLKDQITGTITDLRTSNYTVRLSGDTIDSRFTLLFTGNAQTSLKNALDQSDIAVYPSNGNWYINFDREQINAYIKIYDLNGRLLYTENVPSIIGNYEMKYDLQKNTIYIVNVVSNTSTYTKKILAQ